MPTRQYLTIAFVLLVFGFITGFSIGAPFFLFGLAMVAFAPARGHPLIFWPLLAAVFAGLVAYTVLSPTYCTATSTIQAAPSASASPDPGGSGGGQISTTTCTSILGPTTSYTGTESYIPPTDGAVRLSLVAAAAAGGATFLLTRKGSMR